MLEPFRIAFHNMAPPFGADDLVRDSALELERLLGRSIACKVTVEKRHRGQSRGNLFHIAIELMVSDRRFVVHRDPPEDHTHESLQTAIAEAFHATQRQLQKDRVPAPFAEFRGAGSEAAAAL
jgi:hypothetical protein